MANRLRITYVRSVIRGIEKHRRLRQEEKEIKVNTQITVRAEVALGDIPPGHVQVELYFGALDRNGEIVEGVALPMRESGKGGKGHWLFQGQMLCLQSGQFGFTVRVMPQRSRWKKLQPAGRS